MNHHLRRLLGTELQRAGQAMRTALAGARAAAPSPASKLPDLPDIARTLAGVLPKLQPMSMPAGLHPLRPAARPADVADGGDNNSGGGSFASGSHSCAAGSRAYKLYVPPQAGDRPLPLVVMLHGCTQNPDDFAAGTGMNAAARETGFYVLYPAQDQQANPQRCWNWFKHNHQQRGRGEPEIIAGMVRAVMADHRIDPARVAVAGLSAGGAMAAIVGAAYPDLFCAVGVHSGLAAGAAHDLPSALESMRSGAAGPLRSGVLPTIVFHGDADATVHPRNGAQVAAASAGVLPPVSSDAAPPGRRRATRHVWRDDGGRARAEHWVVHGAPHAWSGGDASGSYTDPSGPSASTEMLRFFAECAQTRPRGDSGAGQRPDL